MHNEELRSFFESHPLAIKAAESLKPGREISLILLSGETSKSFTFKRNKDGNTFTETPASEPDLTFTIPEAVAKELVTKGFDSVGQVGLFLFEKILSSDPDQKIKVKLHTGFLGLMANGYLGILSAGGADVAKFLATKGFGNIGKLKEAISRLRSS